MFTREWFDNELAGLEEQQAKLIVQLHQVDGAISTLRQMRAMLNNGAAPDGAVPLDQFISAVLPGAVVESVDPVEETKPDED